MKANGKEAIAHYKVTVGRSLLALLLAAVCLGGCTVRIGGGETLPLFSPVGTPLPPPQSDNPPVTVQHLVAYRYEDEGVVVYFVLGDRQGRQTNANGQATLILKERETGRILYRTSRTVGSDDYVDTQTGRGLFARRRLIYSFDLIPYTAFEAMPAPNATIEARLIFLTETGRILSQTAVVSR